MTAIDRVLAALPARRLVWFFDGTAIRTRIDGVVTCPVCAAAGAVGTWFWEYEAALGLTTKEGAMLADAADEADDRPGSLRRRMLAATLEAPPILLLE